MLSPDLIERIRSRAADSAARTDALGPGETSFFGGAFKTVRVQMGGGEPSGPAPLPAPATAEDIAAAEAMLGFALPEDLEQLYSEIANGGFGPGDGLASLRDVAKRYRDLMSEPQGWDGQTWPEHLLPLNLTEPGADCYDLKSGEIVLWDEEALAEGPGDDVWRSSFVKDAASLGEWLEAWLAKPPLRQQMDQHMEKVLLDGLRESLNYWRAKTPEERAEYGLPEEGWEDVLFGHLGVDLKTL